MTTTILLLPGAGGMGWYWHRVVPLLERAGHEAIALDLPGADPEAGLDAYADLAVKRVAGCREVVVVAQSMGGFTAPLVATRRSVRGLVLLNAMVPLPGETAGAWWDNVKSDEARVAASKAGGYRTEFDLATYFLHDVPEDDRRAILEHDADEAPVAFRTPCQFDAWPPAIPIHVLVGADDRFFPPEFQERLARERLGASLTSLERVPGGHLAALGHPEPIAERILARLGEPQRVPTPSLLDSTR